MRKYKLPMAGSSLLFISRDNPYNWREFHWAWAAAKGLGRHTIRQTVLAWNGAQRSIARGSIDAAYRAKTCRSREQYDAKTAKYMKYGDCPLHEVCWDKQALAELFEGWL